jgi:hypothetical protein
MVNGKFAHVNPVTKKVVANVDVLDLIRDFVI